MANAVFSTEMELILPVIIGWSGPIFSLFRKRQWKLTEKKRDQQRFFGAFDKDKSGEAEESRIFGLHFILENLDSLVFQDAGIAQLAEQRFCKP